MRINLFAWINLGDGRCLNSDLTSVRNLGCHLIPDTRTAIASAFPAACRSKAEIPSSGRRG